MRLTHAIPLTLASLLALTGCDLVSAATTEVDPPQSGLTGVYTVDKNTENEEGCDAEGDPVVLPLFERLGVSTDASSLLGFGWVLAYGCGDVDNCAARQDDGALIGLMIGGYRLVDGNDADGWRGERDFGVRQEDGRCLGYRQSVHLTRPEDGRIRLEIRHEEVPYDDGSTTGPCDEEQVAQHLTGTCSTLEVWEGAFEQELPPPPES